MIPSAIIAALKADGIHLKAKDGVLHAGPASRLSERHREIIAMRKDDLLSELHHPASEREQETQVLLEIAVDTCQRHLATIARLEKELLLAYDGIAIMASMARAQRRQPAKAIPADVHRILVSLCHPDRNPERQPAATQAMTWLNQQRPRLHP